MKQVRIDRQAGYRLLDELAGPAVTEGTLAGLGSLAPGFPDWIVTALFGGAYQRDGIALRDRQIATLAAPGAPAHPADGPPTADLDGSGTEGGSVR